MHLSLCKGLFPQVTLSDTGKTRKYVGRAVIVYREYISATFYIHTLNKIILLPATEGSNGIYTSYIHFFIFCSIST